MTRGAAPVLVFATRNAGKIVELRQLLAGRGIGVLSLAELDRPVPEVVEDGDTFLDNAAKKARAVSRASGLAALADDSGLEVDALDGAPGVRSARYAGPEATDAANNQKLLEALRGVPHERRTARFRSVLALADSSGRLGEGLITAEGCCEGYILDEQRGSGGFGYDPLFYVPALQATFAELGIGTKNQLSHRARAMQALSSQLAAYFDLAKQGDSG